MLYQDPINFFNSKIVTRHDNVLAMSSKWVEHYNCLMSKPYREDWEMTTLYDEAAQYKYYDV